MRLSGYHWETGSVHNYYALRGVRAPHTGEPYSEPLLLGISGGIVMGYFTFAYEGYDPQCMILTRNTFDPMQTMLSRLGVVQDLVHTANGSKAADRLIDTLADGAPAIVWADMWSLPYTGLRYDERMWGAFPILVCGYERESAQFQVADRAEVPLTISAEELAAARGRIKKEKHRMLTLDIPDPAKLESAVIQGIHDCVKLFTEKPPRGATTNFGLEAYRFWAQMLTAPKGRTSWAKLFAPGAAMYAGLTWAYSQGFLFGKGLDGDGERTAYARFLDEAAAILDRPALRQVANRFRASAEAWRELGQGLLPDHLPPFAQARQLLWRRHERFLRQGNLALAEMREIDTQLTAIRRQMADQFPLTEGETAALRVGIAAQVMRIHDLEQEAILALKEAVS